MSYKEFRRWLCQRWGIHHWRFIGLRRDEYGKDIEQHKCRWCRARMTRPVVDAPPMFC